MANIRQFLSATQFGDIPLIPRRIADKPDEIIRHRKSHVDVRSVYADGEERVSLQMGANDRCIPTDGRVADYWGNVKSIKSEGDRYKWI